MKKFIDVEFNLPAPDYKEFINFHMQPIQKVSKYFQETYRYYAYGEIINGTIVEMKPYKGLLADTIERLVSYLGFTLRMIEKLFLRAKLTIESLSDDDLLLPEVIFILNALYICDKKAFDTYVNAAAYNANLGDLGLKVNHIYPYWSGVLNNFNDIFLRYQKSGTTKSPSKELNVANLAKLLQTDEFIFKNQFKRNIDLNMYLKSYASKIEFIGSMD